MKQETNHIRSNFQLVSVFFHTACKLHFNRYLGVFIQLRLEVCCVVLSAEKLWQNINDFTEGAHAPTVISQTLSFNTV